MMKESYKLARNNVALLNLQTDGRFRVSGPDAEVALNQLISVDLEVLSFWKGVIGLFLTETANIMAIATIFKCEDGFYIFTEADSADDLCQYLAAEIPTRGAVFEDLRNSHEWLSVLGPRAQDVMSKSAGEDILGLPYLSFEENERLGVTLFRMGFCGEFEYRLLIPVDRGEAVATLLLEGGAEFGIGQVSPEIMHVLMLEMRSLTKADLPENSDPIQAGLHWMISFRKESLRGGEVIHKMKLAAARQSLMLRIDQSGCVTKGDRLQIEGQDVGFLSCVVYSPTLETDIGLAFIDQEFAQNGVSFDAKGRNCNTKAMGASAPLFVTKTVQSA
ncbi:MAG: hypothetical protein KJ900_17685 [Proteobacteria bacterium]|nr:aminomethyl transferase family protein [Desulfocapsa sp.]MBU4030526.1 hypothetical protein [Pseudomonadota bacterium]MBU4044696.1 hypothetical protein [Pseudomonadota bacterium]